MKLYHWRDFDKLTKPETGPYIEPWSLHDEGYRRELESLDVFVHYAMSPETEKVVPTAPTKSFAFGELRAYGGGDKEVWFTWEYPASSFLFGNMHILIWKLVMNGKLARA